MPLYATAPLTFGELVKDVQMPELSPVRAQHRSLVSDLARDRACMLRQVVQTVESAVNK